MDALKQDVIIIRWLGILVFSVISYMAWQVW